MKYKIAPYEIEAWAGSKATKADMLSLLHELINGSYTVDEFRADVLEYIEQEDV